MLRGHDVHAASLERRRERQSIWAAARLPVVHRRAPRARGLRRLAQVGPGQPPLFQRLARVVARRAFAVAEREMLEERHDHRLLRRR